MNLPSNAACVLLEKSLGLARGVEFADEIDLAAIPYDGREVERARQWVSRPAGADVLDIDGEDDVLAQLTPAVLALALREGVREEVARQCRIGRDGRRGDGRRYNARIGVWELW